MKNFSRVILINLIWIEFSLVSSAEIDGDTIVFYEDFTEQQLDPQKWEIITGDGCPELCGFGNQEIQKYTKQSKNLRIKDGYLIIQANIDPEKENRFTSAKVTTLPTGGWTYGTFSVRAKISKGIGTWPAIWMMPKTEIYGKWPHSGEIDIMENVGFAPEIIHGSVHSGQMNGMFNNHRTGKISVPNAATEFHVYSVEWSKDKITWTVDDKPYYEITRNDNMGHSEWPFDHPFYLILNLAVGGNWGGQQGIDKIAFPTQLVVDWVKVSQE